ncbi:hypothetical protein [Phocaeicola barnesiae]|uniref:hypothetical protein n=1 Tax=Phocaeicola barnesiae TaxID=376804 RepID=UPI000368F872|nr:hypothetical protein [Phocaeicola barnesiae]
MRKKYLSALLFGALLFASAGTFTSCKDYDDDINNLQEQINTIASSLNDLKTKVDALGGYVENVTFADGVLSVTTGGNTVTYNIPDKTGVNEVALALEGNNLVLTVDGNKQTIELPSQEIPEIKVENGILYVGDKEYPLTVDVDNNVQIVDDNIPGNETIGVQINGETVAFPKAFADVRISLGNDEDFYFTDAKFADSNNGDPTDKQENGIHWTIASSDTKWDGPKGDIKAGLVVGQVTAAEVSVRPINYDLAAASKAGQLTLVSSKGEVAPVTVIATPGQKQGPLTNGSRAADVNFNTVDQGDYVLTLQFDKFTEGKEAEEIISKFANEDQTANIKYALALNGVVVTDYKFIIDTQLKADAQPSCEAPKPENFVIGGLGEWNDNDNVLENVPADGLYHNMSYLDGRIYDMKVAINAKDVADAEVYGVEIKEDKENGTSSIMAGQNAVGRTFALDVTLIDINGNISKTETINIKFAEAQKQTVTLSPVTYNVTPAKDKSLLVDVGNVFSSLSASEAISIDNLNNIDWQVEDKDATFLWKVDEFNNLNGNTGLIKYYDKDMNDIDMNDDKIDEAVRSIRYVKFIIDADNYPNPGAKRGEHLISVTINRNISASDNNSTTKLIKKVNIPVHVVRPDWEDVFVKNGEWNGDKFVTRITSVNVGPSDVYTEAGISMNAFDEVKDSEWDGAADGIYLTKLEYTKDGNNNVSANKAEADLKNITTQYVKLDYEKLTENIDKTHKLAYNTMHSVAAYMIGGVEDFIITKEFDVQLQSIFEGTTLMYGDKSVATLNAADYTIDGSKLVLKLKGNSVNVTTTALNAGIAAPYYADNKFILKENITNFTMVNEISYAASADASGLVGAGAKVTTTGVQITKDSGQVNNGGTFTLTFTDIMGVQTTTSINFELSK